MTEREKRIEEMIYKVYLDDESGGSLHIVIGDGNFEDNHIKYCLESVIPKIDDDERRSLYEECAKGLLSLKLSRRYSLASSAWYIYRKADEVRKETAEVFSNRIKSLILEFYGAKDLEDLGHKDRYGIISRDYIWKGLRRLEKEFGVEEEE